MRVLWVVCLLFGSISCAPVGKDYGSSSGSNDAFYPWYYVGGNRQAFDPSSSSSLPSQPQPGSRRSELPVPQYAPSSGGYSGYDSSAYAGYGFYDAAPAENNMGSGSATNYGEYPAPVFSDVSDLEPVYSFSSRSRYQRGRAVYAETRYSPGEQVYPVPRYISRSTSQGGPAANPAKGTF